MPMRRICRFLSFLMLSTVLYAIVACKPGVPGEYIQPGDLEDILYDLHIADGMAVADGNYSEIAYKRMAYREAVLRKYEVSQAQLDSSLIYYYRHTEELHAIYKELAKRLDAEAVALGASANELSQFGTITSQGDTATVWNYRQTAVLMPQPPYNTISFEVMADTAYHEGDKMILSFDTRFLYQDGARNGIAYLAVRFKNDSTAVQTIHLGVNTHINVQLSDDKRVGIKAVNGFIHLGRDNTNSPSLKLMAVSDMKLMRMHTKPPGETDGEDTDSAQSAQPAQSLTQPQGIPVQGNPDARIPLRPQVHNHDIPQHAPPESAPPPAASPHEN